jgi:hypothetical protein
MSVREERVLFLFIRSRLKKSYGQLLRLGALNYARALAEGGYLDSETYAEYKAIEAKDPDYLERLIKERAFESIGVMEQAYQMDIQQALDIAGPPGLHQFFNINIRQALGEQKFQAYLQTILKNPYDDQAFIRHMLNEAGKVNGGKTDSNSHDVNQVYNWLIEIQRGNE